MREGLSRFVDAQAQVWPAPLEEIRRGRKESHWMWFVFPQLRGLGRSQTAQYYGIEGREEARAYLDHPLLGPRLIETGQAMLAHAGTAPEVILGPVDARKLRSSATLFRVVGGKEGVFNGLLEAFYNGTPCAETVRMLNQAGDAD